MDITDAQWDYLSGHLSDPGAATAGKGRPRLDNRVLLNGVLWILRTGAPWGDLPARYGSSSTAHRRYQEWIKHGLLERIVHLLVADLIARGQIDLSEAYIDGTFASAKKGALWLVQQSAEKGARSWQLQTAMVFLSRPGLQALRHMKSHLLKQRLPNDSHDEFRSD